MLSGMGSCRLPKDIQRARKDFALLMNQLNEPSYVLDSFRPGNKEMNKATGTQANGMDRKSQGLACSKHEEYGMNGVMDQNRSPNIPADSSSFDDICTTEQRFKYRWPYQTQSEEVSAPKKWRQDQGSAGNFPQPNVLEKKNRSGVRRKLENSQKHGRRSLKGKHRVIPKKRRPMNDNYISSISNENMGARMDVPSNSRLDGDGEKHGQIPKSVLEDSERTKAAHLQNKPRHRSGVANQLRSSITNENMGALDKGMKILEADQKILKKQIHPRASLSEYQTRFQWPEQDPEDIQPSFPIKAWGDPQQMSDQLFEEDSLENFSVTSQHKDSIMEPDSLASLKIESSSSNAGAPQLDSGKAIYEGFESQSSVIPENKVEDFHATKETSPRDSSSSYSMFSQASKPLHVERGSYGESDSTVALVDGVPTKQAKAYNYATSARDVKTLRNQHGQKRSGRCLACYKPLAPEPVVASSGIWDRLYHNQKSCHNIGHRNKCNACLGKSSYEEEEERRRHLTGRQDTSHSRTFPNKSYSVPLPLYGDSFCVDPKVSQVFMHPRLPLQSTLGDRRRSEYTKSYAWPEKNQR